jgi:DNA helicase II / ATP-dependent DNA helicase PcrA
VNSLRAEELLRDLDDEQRAVATAVRGPLLVIAGAGTGKTRAITYRLAYGAAIGVFDPQKILALTFTAKAAGEMRSRLRSLGVAQISARTFHSAALRQLIYFWPEVFGGRFPQLLTSKSGFIQEAIARSAIDLSTKPSSLRDIAAEIEWSKSLGITPDAYPESAERASRLVNASLAEVAKCYEAYEQLKRDERAIDFEDLLLLTIGMIESEREVASRIRDQYRFFTVDEYQDVSPLQERLLDLWLGNRKDICVVGDPAQTIYSFAGASSSFLLNFTKKHGGAEVIRLNRGYRSTQEIINTANLLLRHSNLGQELIAGEISHGDQPEIRRFESFAEEVQSIVKSISQDLDSGRSASDIAILVRTNSQIDTIEKYLVNSGIEYQVKGNEKFFDRKEINDALRIIRSASVLSESGTEWIKELEDILAPLGKSENIRALLNLAYETFDANSLRDFLRELEERKEQNNPPNLPGITLATLHSAKGLEWERVYLIGLSKAYLPWPTSPVDEERRLFYVGITRAKSHLTMSYGGSPSPFLAEIARG